MIQSYDYDWIGIFVIMNYVLGVWGSVEPVQNAKTSSIGATCMAPSAAGRAAR